MTFTTDALLQLIRADGLLLLFPLAVLEGPIISVLAGWLVRLGYLPLWWTFGVLILADLVGDGVLYAVGRAGNGFLPRGWRSRLGLSEARIAQVADHFRAHGGWTLIGAKLTHSFGFAALVAAGAARMPFPAFLWFNLVGTVPKTLFFLMIGYAVGQAHVNVNAWIGWVSLAIAILGVAALSHWLWKRNGSKP